MDIDRRRMEGSTPSPTSPAQSLFPPQQQQHDNSSSASQYLASPTSYHRNDGPDHLGISSAHRRNSSPISWGEAETSRAREVRAAGGTSGGGSGTLDVDGLHRRAPSRARRKSRDTSGSYSNPGRNEEDIVSAGEEWGDAPTDENERRQAWGGAHASTSRSTLDNLDSYNSNRPSDTLIRPLPQSPGDISRAFRQNQQQYHQPSHSSQFDQVSLHDDPLRSGSHYANPEYSNSNSSIPNASASNLSRIDSRATFDSSSEDGDDDGYKNLTIFHQFPSGESSDSLPPPQSTSKFPSPSPRASSSFHLSRPQFLGGTPVTPPKSTSGSHNRRPSKMYPSGSPLGRQSTLKVAANGIRRMSLRVVNLAGAGGDTLLQETDNPTTKNHPHKRLSDQEIGAEESDSKEEEINEMEPEVTGSELSGRTLGIFGPRHWLRLSCASVLRWTWTEPIILLCIFASVIILTVQSAPNVYNYPRPTSGYFHSWEDYALFALFCGFTVEIFARIIVTGLILNPEYFNSSASVLAGVKGPVGALSSFRSKLANKGYPPSAPPISPDDPMERPIEKGYTTNRILNSSTSSLMYPTISSRRAVNISTTSTMGLASQASTLSLRPAISTPFAAKSSTPFVMSIRQQRKTYQQAFLRHSWNRIDFIAVISFWASFVLAGVGVEAGNDLYLFRALSVLRATRLLAVTQGTTTILQSLKRASPQLVNVAMFVIFAMTMFSIVGVQSFQGSFRRHCLYVDPTGTVANVTFGNQHCGGYFGDALSTTATAFISNSTGLPALQAAKGFLCPYPSVCIEGINPNNGAMSFDNIFAALLQVVIVASANTWTVVMFDMMDAEYFFSCLFFIVCLIVLNFWLINMFVAVITNTFASIRDETRHSAFSSTTVVKAIDELGAQAAAVSRGFRRGPSLVREAYRRTRYLWIAVIVTDIALQASKRNDTSATQLNLLSNLELYLTLALDAEIAIRAFACLPDWRLLFSEGKNVADITLAIMTSLIQIPIIHNSGAYPWLTFFQIARFYRVVLAIPRMRRLLSRVLGTLAGLFNMIIFMVLMNFLGALIAVQLIRGVPVLALNETPEMTFFQIYNSFLAMYQILSSENWTDVLNNVLTSERGQFQIAVAAAFLAIWLLFAYFILVNMFIAVLNENFSIAEELKHKQQMEAFVRNNGPQAATVTWVRKFNPYNFLRPRPKAERVENIPSNLVLPMKKAVVRDYLTGSNLNEKSGEIKDSGDLGTRAKKAFRMSIGQDPSAGKHTTDPVGNGNFPSELFPTAEGEQDQDLANARGIASERRALQNDFITAHPSYDRSLWVFSQKNYLRRFCQRLVDPAHGEERIRGRAAVPREKLAFQAVIFAAIVSSLVVAGYATPLYRRNYFIEHGETRWNWFNLAEISLGMIFIIEFLVKVMADGFIFAPNAYLLSIWNDLDFFILVTLVINVASALISPGGVSRFTRALKAFRALRFINLSATMRETFYNVLIVGAGRILDASLLAILYIIPFAVWGQNIFAGLLYSCNDTSVVSKAECAGEFLNTAVSTWGYLTPRIWSNPYVWTFDTFRGALLILFEIISLEGWINVMESSMQIAGRDLQPIQDISQFNALFFVFYNLIGAVFILTLFVSVILENFHRRSGMLLLTSEQQDWIQLRKLILRQRPEKRPARRPSTAFRSWCYDRAVEKHGWWSKMLTGLYLLHIVVLMSQAATNPGWVGKARNFIFLGFTVIYLLDIFVRTFGLGWSSYLQNGWNIYDVAAVVGTFATTLPILLGTTNEAAIQLQKLFLVSIAFKLIQKNDSLNQLFKTAAASLPAIFNIFALWLVLFFVWAIFYLEVFGLTRWNVYGTRIANYSSFWNVMVMLVLASTGEGWNGFMHDYTLEFPHCTESANYLFSDCGSAGWAYALFITWNILSMYLMSNLILGSVVENFSYVFQTRGETSLDREQMRSYKSAWAQFDATRSGYISKQDIVPFFARLTGVFEVKIFRDEWSINHLEAACAPADGFKGKTVYAKRCHGNTMVDIARLPQALRTIDFDEVKQRKHLYNRIYHEAMLLDSESEKGISFTKMLLLLSHYKLIREDRALRLEEQIKRREHLEKVSDRVDIDRVHSLLKVFLLRRKFVAAREARRLAERGIVPDIVIESEDTSPADVPTRRRELSIDTTLYLSQTTRAPSPHYSPSRRTPSPFSLSPSDGENEGRWSEDGSSDGSRSSSPRRQSIQVENGEQVVIDLLSKWGGGFVDEEEED